jgi:hypothetical protein
MAEFRTPPRPDLVLWRRALRSSILHTELARCNRGWWPWADPHAVRYHESVADLYRRISDCALEPTATCNAGHAYDAKLELDNYTQILAMHGGTPRVTATMIGLPDRI